MRSWAHELRFVTRDGLEERGGFAEWLMEGKGKGKHFTVPSVTVSFWA
jgi:hypothetical protein